ncbi:hypothetical protein T4A_8336 [Trichinella pseudospiralis]|uniref:Uncharacterized protein n=1 Tax=Trichinella pseudospiralis TaxID=6337 RepID=A0A0V1E7G3_TRIPS|nr:hypothetical protein T4A_8336 [Trichinella pseudospiralis]
MIGVAVISAEHPDLIAEANRLPLDEHLCTMATEFHEAVPAHCVVYKRNPPYPAALTSSVGHGEANNTQTT